MSQTGQGEISFAINWTIAIVCFNETKLLSTSLYQLMYLRFIYYKLKLIDVITISTSLSISHDYYNHVKYYSKDKIGAINMYVIIYIYKSHDLS